MPTIIALDTSLSMQRTIPGRSDHTYHQLALKGISQLLDYLTISKLEYISLLTYSSTCEVKVDFTRDYDQVRQAVKKVESGDKACVLSMLKSCATVMATSWGVQNVCQVVVFTDCGVGFGSTAIKSFLETHAGKDNEAEYAWLKTLKSIKLNFICMGLHSDNYFTSAVALYQQLVDFVCLKGQLFMTKPLKEATSEAGDGTSTTHVSHKSELGRTAMFELVERLCEASFRPLEVILKCGGDFRLESPVLIWPPPVPYLHKNDKLYTLSQKIEVCGYLALSEIGSPASLSRHLVLAKMEREKPSRRSSEKSSSSSKSANASSSAAARSQLDPNSPNFECEKLEQDIREFYVKESKETEESGDDADAAMALVKSSGSNEYKETLCALLHGALKVENLAALVLLSDCWFGFIYAYSDSKKKSNLMLNILPPGNNVIPWLGNLQNLGFADELQPGETSTFPVKAEKRSYSQNCVVWIRRASLQSDIQKVLRHAKKMPDKIQNFYKELNRIRRAALSIGFVELLESLATLLEKESAQLSLNNAGSDCLIQLHHAASELRKTSNRDLKVTIAPFQKFVPTDSSATGAPGGGGGGGGGGVGTIEATPGSNY